MLRQILILTLFNCTSALLHGQNQNISKEDYKVYSAFLKTEISRNTKRYFFLFLDHRCNKIERPTTIAANLYFDARQEWKQYSLN